MAFDAIPRGEIQDYLSRLGDKTQAMSVFLTDGTMLSGVCSVGMDLSRPLTLEAFWSGDPYRVAIPTDRIAGIIEQVTSTQLRADMLDASLLALPARHAGLQVEYDGQGLLFAYSEPDREKWRAPSVPTPIWYEQDSWLYLDADAIRNRSGGINSIGFGIPVGSGSIGWDSPLINKAKRFLKRNVVDIGAHCIQKRSSYTLRGYVEFWDVSTFEPSSENGPLLQLEGARWGAAVVRRSPPAVRSSEGPWALCYFRQDRLSLGAASWERIAQPVHIYGDNQPRQQKTDLGTAPCYLMARAAMAFA